MVLRPLQGGWLVIWREQGSQHRTEMWCISCNLRIKPGGRFDTLKGTGDSGRDSSSKSIARVYPKFWSIDKAALSQSGSGNRWWGQTWTSLKVKPIRFVDEQNLWSKKRESQGWLQGFAQAVKEPSCLVRWERLQEESAWGEYQELKFKMCNGSRTLWVRLGERCIALVGC